MATLEKITDSNMDAVETPLWRSLDQMRIEPPGAAITFTAKLARDNGWGSQRAEAVMHEYRRFLYLAGTSGGPVSPSKAVDRAWHLHLTYSRHYWDVLCGQILQRPLHHDPSLGGHAEDARHRDQYEHTLDLYRQTFGEEPPAAIWPSPAAPRQQPRRAALRLGGAASAAFLLAACTALSAATAEVEEEGDALLGFIIIGVFVAMVYFTVKRMRRGRGGGRGRRAGASGGAYGAYDSHDRDYDSSDNDGGGDGGSSCGGGCGGGGD